MMKLDHPISIPIPRTTAIGPSISNTNIPFHNRAIGPHQIRTRIKP